MAALMLVLGGGRLARPGNEDSVALILLVFAVPLFIVVSVISYRLLKPRSEDR
jgi:hypothetical protein